MHEHFWERFRQEAQEGLQLWESPSVSVGVVKDGQVVLCEGFGLRDEAGGLPADGQTLYQIGSCSKAFTAALVAILVDQGKLDWDTPIRQYVPEVRFYDEYLTRSATLRDLLSHRTGLPRHEYAWYGTDFTKEQLIHNLRYLEPNQPMRTVFQYNNQCYILAGYIVERLTGKTYEQCLSEYLFEPLGMTRTCAFLDDIEGDANHATPYDRPDPLDVLHGKRAIPFYRMPAEDKAAGIGTPLGPAGSINSCPEDMLKWVQLHLNHGRVGDRQLISEAAMAQLHHPQMLLQTPLDMPMDEAAFHCYGLGWFLESFRGKKLLQHGGNINGFSGFTAFLPEENLGVVAYTNMNGSYLHYALARTVLDHYLGYEDGNWVRRYRDFVAERQKKLPDQMAAFTGKQVPGTHPAHELAEYAGVYRRDGYTPVTVTVEDGRLHLDFIGTRAALTHYHYETFLVEGVVGELPPRIPVHFHTAEVGGAVDGLAMPLVTEPGGSLIRFQKQEG